MREPTRVRTGDEPIPEATVARLPVYLRGLLELADAGVETVSSVGLAELVGVNAAMVERMWSMFKAMFSGCQGKQGPEERERAAKARFNTMYSYARAAKAGLAQ